MRATSDASWSDALAEMGQCATTTCAEGWLLHVGALEQWEADDFAGARETSARADAMFGARPSAVNGLRSFMQVALDRIAGQPEVALRRLEALRPYAAARRYWTVAGRVEWQTGLLAAERNDLGAAMRSYVSASAYFAQARDREGEAVVGALIAASFQQLDDMERAWEYEFAALSRLEYARTVRRIPILGLAALFADASDLPAAAVAFRAPLIREAQEAGAPARLANRLAEDATSLRKLNLPQAARARVDEAARVATAITDSGPAASTQALVAIARGRVLLETEPLQAAMELGRAIQIYRQRNNEFATAELELDRGAAFRRVGRLADAEAAFEGGLAAAEHERRGIVSDAQRVAALAARWDLYASLVDIRLARDDESGLALLRRSRAVNLAEHLGRVPATSFTVPDGTVAIEYAWLPSGAHVWVSTSRGRTRFKLPMPTTSLATRIEQYRQAIQRRDSSGRTTALSREIYNALIAPFEHHLATAQRVVIVPDGPLHDVPFAALWDPSTHGFLVERVAITVTPSLEFYWRPLVALPTVRSPLDALVIGNPDRGSATDDRLPDLPGAEREARAVAALYRRGSVLTGERATRHAFLENIPRAEMVHFAGHALSIETRPERSRLLLAPSSADPLGVVFAGEIERLSLPATRLVVLSACETGLGRLARGEGVIGLARAFLSAGIPSVVATLWPVDDVSTATLFTTFHESWRRGATSAVALRDAQLRAIRDGVSVTDWAAAQVLGQTVTRTP